MTIHRIATLALLPSLLLMQGCVPAIVGGAAGGAAVVHDRRSTSTLIADQEVELKVFNYRQKDPELLKHTDIYSDSFNRQLLLTGAAATPRLAEKVVNYAKGLSGVRRVINEIEIHPEGTEFKDSVKDSYINSKVKLALLKIDLADFDPTRIKATTYNGSVYLMGLVTQQEANAAAEEVRFVSDVKRVVKYFEYIEKAIPPSGGSQPSNSAPAGDSGVTVTPLGGGQPSGFHQ